jgi:K+-sensing histidine kinase KdpD
VKFSEHGGTVRVAREVIEDSLRIVIEGEGRVLPARAASRFFELFSIGEASTPAGDLGLGPAVACRILSLFGASVSVESREPSGIRLIVSFSRDARVGPEAARQRRT